MSTGIRRCHYTVKAIHMHLTPKRLEMHGCTFNIMDVDDLVLKHQAISIHGVDELVIAWWRHQMETFSLFLAICAENSPVTGEFLTQRPMARSFDVFFDLCLNKRLSKQSRCWWFETPSRSLWRHCNGIGPVSYQNTTCVVENIRIT